MVCRGWVLHVGSAVLTLVGLGMIREVTGKDSVAIHAKRPWSVDGKGSEYLGQ